MKLKTIVFGLLLFIMPMGMSGQYLYGGQGHAYFFGHQPSARAEAMGRSYVSFEGDLSTAYFNPAGISTIQGLEVDASIANPYYLLEEAHFYFASAGFKISKYLAGAATFHQFSLGELEITDESGNTQMIVTPQVTNYKLTLAAEPFRRFYIGLNMNMFQYTPRELFNSSDVYYLDFGLLKEFAISEVDRIQVGGSVVNLNSAAMDFEHPQGNHSEELPVISRLGANYRWIYNPPRPDSLNLLECIGHAEVEDLLNAKYLTSWKCGLEIKLIEIFSVRAGYYTQSQYDFGNPEANYSTVDDFTYGFGLSIPIEKLTQHKVPMNINFDYTSLAQVRHASTLPYGYDELGKFTSMSLRITWDPWNK